MTLAIVLATCTMTMAQAQGRLKGKITDDSGQPVPFANVIVEKGGTQVGGASSDFDGNYDINPIPPGTYDLKVILLAGMTSPRNTNGFKPMQLALRSYVPGGIGLMS